MKNREPYNHEELKIYKQVITLIYYTEELTMKYPKFQKDSLVTRIKDSSYNLLNNIIEAYKTYDKKNKLEYLNKLDIELKMLKAYARISYRLKYINARNYGAWSKKIHNIGKLTGGWINICLKQ